ncbi:putative mediator of RNA polymerase II transcription subunit 19b isoform B [Glycine soja]|uniref:Putative mediator of RNA polymerase II transcription subunit 19b isoform A n=1 Tax=Glycine soja TaxID=3848 RepID=A0A445JCD0_GLYSO|nr:putative mediator of RNA polymerase II transcription subunit 19b isoform A [Glycine soja]RZB96155.1 putative mediator of RNA polymerase II transcription subunit 19b isoform B [Glycine soja]
MDLEGKKFGRGNKELGGTRDLINQYRLWPYYEFFCKKSLPVSISETHYLHNVVGDTKIRKGEGMELDQLCKNTDTSEKKACLCPFDLDVLSEAFHMRDMNPVHLSSKGLPNAVPKLENQSRDHERKNKKVKDKGEEYRKQKHRLHRVNNGSCIENIRIRPHDPHPLLQLKNQRGKVCSQSFIPLFYVVTIFHSLHDNDDITSIFHSF